MNKIIEVLQLLTESPIGMFSTVFSLLLIAAWLLIRFARKVTRLDLSQKHLEEGHKEILKRIDQLSADMRDGFRKVDIRFEKVDERFEKLEQKMDERFEKIEQKMDERFEKIEQKMDERFEKVDDRSESMDKKFDGKIENLSEKLDRNTEELRKDIANLRTDVRILQHDRHYTGVPVMKTKRYRPSNKRKAVASF
ncbi:MAG: hypothetical protein IKO75_07720 [Bacteroidales bacterium]|nr:hypothetical protein [Bacteroidales bacterium]